MRRTWSPSSLPANAESTRTELTKIVVLSVLAEREKQGIRSVVASIVYTAAARRGPSPRQRALSGSSIYLGHLSMRIRSISLFARVGSYAGPLLLACDTCTYAYYFLHSCHGVLSYVSTASFGLFLLVLFADKPRPPHRSCPFVLCLLSDQRSSTSSTPVWLTSPRASSGR